MLNKDDFVKELSRVEKVTLSDANKMVDAVLKGIMRATKNKGGVKFVGFGQFENRKTKARVGRNPQTGEAINIPENRKPVFEAGTVFENMIRDTKKKSTPVEAAPAVDAEPAGEAAPATEKPKSKAPRPAAAAAAE